MKYYKIIINNIVTIIKNVNFCIIIEKNNFSIFKINIKKNKGMH